MNLASQASPALGSARMDDGVNTFEERAVEERVGEQNGVPSGSDPQHRYAVLLEDLLGVTLASTALGELCNRLLELALQAAGASVGVLLLRETSRLVPYASFGSSDEVAAGWSLSLERALGDRPLHVAPGLFVVSEVGLIPSPTPLRQLVGLPLLDVEETLGVIYLGNLAKYPLGAEDQRFLDLIAGRGAASIRQRQICEALQRDVRVRDDVLGIVAHDLQNPLNVISMAAHMLLHRVSDPVLRRPVERIQHSTQRATRLLRDLLDVGAMERGHFAIERRPVEPAALILSALESQQSLAADASVITAADLSPRLPAIDADEERLLEVLENLIGNAIKFTSPGGTITVGAEHAGDDIRIWVSDNGAGIPEEQLPLIFDRFWQAKRTDRRGTGLGLAICKGIVEAHSGRIWAESSLGKGTTIYFAISAVAPQSAYQAIKVANILLVDDRRENLLVLETILERPEYRLVRAETGEEALRLALRERFSVALIDIAMPGMNGLEVATHLKAIKRSRDLPIIFVTAFGDDPEEIHRAYAAGGVDYLVKPLDAEIVRKKVAVFVELSRRQQSPEEFAKATARG